MKKYFIPLVVVLFVIPLLYIGCRDHIERNIKAEGYPLDTITPTPHHCSNGVLDSGETDIDCGGPCKACTATSLPCSVGTNSLVISCDYPGQGYGEGTYPITLTSSSYNSGSGLFEFKGTSTFGTIWIKLLGSAPLTTHTYTDVDSPPTTTGEAYIYLYYNGGQSHMYGYYQAYPLGLAGTVTVTKTGGKYAVTLCSEKWVFYSVNTVVFTISANMTQP